MTLANKITILRLLLIPVFVLATLKYIRDFQHGNPDEVLRLTACLVFLVASLTDAVDGYIARRYHQKSELGSWLDPLADKALLLSALVLLSRDTGEAFQQLPLWFPVLVISRDVFLVVGILLIHIFVGKALARPRLVGKCATFFQMVTLAWILLKIQQPSPQWPLYLAGGFTLVSGIWYLFDGIKQLHPAEGQHAPPPATG
ncbi:CDP-diacylglycerol--glycerol-3-phosphate 3-phosphatidyltransferase [bacterium]|nr:CDP-diacylglycerol--glycerol-3-phosphate 3-phosphatidyltransferase [bacterium]